MFTNIILSTTLYRTQIENNITACSPYKELPIIVRSIGVFDIFRNTLNKVTMQQGIISFSSINKYPQLSEEINIINTMLSNDIVVMIEPKNKYKIKIKVRKTQKAIPNLIDIEGIYE